MRSVSEVLEEMDGTLVGDIIGWYITQEWTVSDISGITGLSESEIVQIIENNLETSINDI